MMDIYYYSGRGNSLSVAKELAQGIPDARLIPAPKAARGPEIEVAPDTAIGLVFPVIDFGVPASIRALIAKFRKTGASPYVFAVVTTGGMPAGVLGQARRLLGRRGLALSVGKLLVFSLQPGDEAVRRARMKELEELLRGRSKAEVEAGSLLERVLLTGALNLVARLSYPRDDGKFVVGPGCDGCGICSRLCPAANIAIEDGKPAWKGRCEQCGACFAWCPREAVSGSCLAAKTRYTNPKIKLPDMLATTA
jgi:ferredoxin